MHRQARFKKRILTEIGEGKGWKFLHGGEKTAGILLTLGSYYLAADIGFTAGLVLLAFGLGKDKYRKAIKRYSITRKEQLEAFIIE